MALADRPKRPGDAASLAARRRLPPASEGSTLTEEEFKALLWTLRSAYCKAIAESRLGNDTRLNALDDLVWCTRRGLPVGSPETPEVVRAIFRHHFGDERLGDEEFDKRQALTEKYGAVWKAPEEEQGQLRRLWEWSGIYEQQKA
jgi:hypothetical protein